MRNPFVERLDPKVHDRIGFSCGERSLDIYLREQAAQHHRDGIATTHVLVDPAMRARILGYYTLSAAQLLLSDLAETDRRHPPRYPVPAARLGRLAVATFAQGQGHGDFLLAHVVARCLDLRAQLGVRVLVVDALHEAAAAFYCAYGFRPAAVNARSLYLPLGKS